MFREKEVNTIIGTDYNVNITNPKTNVFGGQTPKDISEYISIYHNFSSKLPKLGISSVYDFVPSKGDRGGEIPATKDVNFTTNYGLEGNCCFEECIDFIWFSNTIQPTAFKKSEIAKPVSFSQLDKLQWLIDDFDHSNIIVNFCSGLD